MSVLSNVLIDAQDEVVWVRRVDLREFEVDRKGHRALFPEEEKSNDHVNEALRRRIPDLDAIRDPGNQEALAPCVARARAAYLESRRGIKSLFPLSEVMDWMRVSPDGFVVGPFTPECLAKPTAARD